MRLPSLSLIACVLVATALASPTPKQEDDSATIDLKLGDQYHKAINEYFRNTSGDNILKAKDYLEKHASNQSKLRRAQEARRKSDDSLAKKYPRSREVYECLLKMKKSKKNNIPGVIGSWVMRQCATQSVYRLIKKVHTDFNRYQPAEADKPLVNAAETYFSNRLPLESEGGLGEYDATLIVQSLVHDKFNKVLNVALKAKGTHGIADWSTLEE